MVESLSLGGVVRWKIFKLVKLTGNRLFHVCGWMHMWIKDKWHDLSLPTDKRQEPPNMGLVIHSASSQGLFRLGNQGLEFWKEEQVRKWRTPKKEKQSWKDEDAWPADPGDQFFGGNQCHWAPRTLPSNNQNWWLNSDRARTNMTFFPSFLGLSSLLPVRKEIQDLGKKPRVRWGNQCTMNKQKI